MIIDFTLSVYASFIDSLISRGYKFITFEKFILSKVQLNNSPFIIIRHDVERFPQNALRIAKIEHSVGIKSSYYFRSNAISFNADIIKRIADLGHEIGYHYDDVEMTFWKIKLKNINSIIEENKLIDEAYLNFCENLKKIREITEIKTISMHGSPLSKFDNRILWNKYNYKDLGIIGEPFFDIDWEKTAYFTDTGRRWNGDKVIVRDKVLSGYNFELKSTYQIINNIDKLPGQIVLNVHTHRWFNPGIMWTRELIFQNLKNVIKYFIIKTR